MSRLSMTSCARQQHRMSSPHQPWSPPRQIRRRQGVPRIRLARRSPLRHCRPRRMRRPPRKLLEPLHIGQLRHARSAALSRQLLEPTLLSRSKPRQKHNVSAQPKHRQRSTKPARSTVRQMHNVSAHRSIASGAASLICRHHVLASCHAHTAEKEFSRRCCSRAHAQGVNTQPGEPRARGAR